jgi:PAS domain S-box-containing protein
VTSSESEPVTRLLSEPASGARTQRTEEELRLLIDTIPALVHTALPDGNLDYFNKLWLEFVGVPMEQLLGWGWTKAIHPEDVAGIVAKWRACLASGENFEYETRVRRADGEYRWMVHHKVPLRDEEGRVVKWFGSSLDIEERKRSEERVLRENIALREEVDRSSMFEEIVGVSAPLRSVLAQLARVAPTDSTVLISGETGTGKELVARAIHKGSARSHRAFVAVNCAAIPPSLIASELFGHEKGAFTGALQRRLGRFELADGGTIFLDEVGELPPETQVALLRVLQEREFERVGGTRPIRTDVRVIAASNRDLMTAVAESAFRADLFYRLNVFPLEIPALRDRRADIPVLIEYFLHRFTVRAGKKIRAIAKSSLALLTAYDWPGNVRELQNVVERAVIVSDSEILSIDEHWLPGRPSIPASGVSARPQTLATAERDAIETALMETKGRVAGPFGAASRLGIPSSTLESKIKALQIDKKRFKTAPAVRS